MDNNDKLIQRYNKIQSEIESVDQDITTGADLAGIQAKVAELAAKQDDLKKTLLHLIALAELRNEVWRTLSQTYSPEDSVNKLYG